MVAREVADAGLRVLLLDLTASGAASRPMLDSVSYPGITNLLASEAQFTDAIHADHYSDCHVMPVGTADPARAMRAADRLPIIMESLTTAYDVVVVECGAGRRRRHPAAGRGRHRDPGQRDRAGRRSRGRGGEALKAGGYRRVTLVIAGRPPVAACADAGHGRRPDQACAGSVYSLGMLGLAAPRACAAAWRASRPAGCS